MSASKTKRPTAPAAPRLAQGPSATINAAAAAGHSLRLRWRALTALLLAISTAGYWLATQSLSPGNEALADALRNLFIAGALLTVAIGLTLPGRMSRSADD